MSISKENVMPSAIRLLKNVYADDFVAVSQIITAEANNDTNTIIDYMHCVSDYCNKIVEILSEE